MALEIRRSLTTLLMCFVCMQAQTAAADDDAVTIGGVSLSLMTLDAQCILKIGGELQSMDIPGPCRFLRRSADSAPTFHDYDGTSVALVAGAPANRADFSAFEDLEPSDECSHIGRGIIVKNGEAHLTEVFVSPLGYCPNIAPDEKFYFGIVHPVE